MKTWPLRPRAATRHRVAAAAFFAALVALTGCTAAEPDGPDAIFGTGPAGSPFALTASGVGVIAEGCSLVANLGSGVVVERSAQVATAAHTVRGASMLTVVDAEGRQHPASVTSFDKDSDLALLDVPTLSAPPLSIGTAPVGPATLPT